MPQDMKIWRRNARQKLIAELGGKCVFCGATEETCGKLEFEHKVPLTDEEYQHRKKIGANGRMVLNRKEAREGKLQLACHPCNIQKSVRQTRCPEPTEEPNWTVD